MIGRDAVEQVGWVHMFGMAAFKALATVTAPTAFTSVSIANSDRKEKRDGLSARASSVADSPNERRSVRAYLCVRGTGVVQSHGSAARVPQTYRSTNIGTCH